MTHNSKILDQALQKRGISWFKVAGELKVPVSTLKSWVNRGSIPENQWDDVLRAFQIIGEDLEASGYKKGGKRRRKAAKRDIETRSLLRLIVEVAKEEDVFSRSDLNWLMDLIAVIDQRVQLQDFDKRQLIQMFIDLLRREST